MLYDVSFFMSLNTRMQGLRVINLSGLGTRIKRHIGFENWGSSLFRNVGNYVWILRSVLSHGLIV